MSSRQEIIDCVESLVDYLEEKSSEVKHSDKHRRALDMARDLQQSLKDGDLEQAKGQSFLLYQYGTDSLPWTKALLSKLNYLHRYTPRL